MISLAITDPEGVVRFAASSRLAPPVPRAGERVVIGAYQAVVVVVAHAFAPSGDQHIAVRVAPFLGDAPDYRPDAAAVPAPHGRGGRGRCSPSAHHYRLSDSCR